MIAVAPDAVAALVRRDRAVLLSGIAVVSAVAWAHLAGMASSHDCSSMSAMPTTRSWSAWALAAAAVMWGVMMVGMMLPVVAPWLLAVSASARRRSPQIAPFPEALAFLSGYGVVWLALCVVLASGQLLLQRAALLSAEWATTSPALGGGLLLVAGVYQWSPLRDACMKHCRSPLAFFLSSWREGRWGAFTMGVRHGTYCAGCCWALMTLSFVFGVMNLLWMAVATLFLLVEKVTSAGPRTSKVAGVVLVACGAWMLVRS